MKQEQVNIKAPVCCLMTSHCSQVDPRHLSQPASHAAEGTHKAILHEKHIESLSIIIFSKENVIISYFICRSKWIQLCHRISEFFLNMKQNKQSKRHKIRSTLRE